MHYHISYKEYMKTNSIEQFGNSVTDVFIALRERGDVKLPCPNPQPWNESAYKPSFAAPSAAHVVPTWCFQAYPLYERHENVMRFGGMRILVIVTDATMSGKIERFVVNQVDDIGPTLNRLNDFRLKALVSCNHRNHRHVRNLGRCYNEYQCNDCGHVFQIDSGD